MFTDQLSQTLADIPDLTRYAIVARMTHWSATDSQLAEPLEVTLPKITRPLMVLKRAGAIGLRRNPLRSAFDGGQVSKLDHVRGP